MYIILELFIHVRLMTSTCTVWAYEWSRLTTCQYGNRAGNGYSLEAVCYCVLQCLPTLTKIKWWKVAMVIHYHHLWLWVWFICKLCMEVGETYRLMANRNDFSEYICTLYVSYNLGVLQNSDFDEINCCLLHQLYKLE